MASPHRPRAGSRAGRSGRPGAVRRGGSTLGHVPRRDACSSGGPRWRKADRPHRGLAGYSRVTRQGRGVSRGRCSGRWSSCAPSGPAGRQRGPGRCGCTLRAAASGRRRAVARGHAAGSGADRLQPIVSPPCDRVDPLREEGLRNGYRAPASFRDASGSLQQGCRGKGMMRPPRPCALEIGVTRLTLSQPDRGGGRSACQRRSGSSDCPA